MFVKIKERQDQVNCITNPIDNFAMINCQK